MSASNKQVMHCVGIVSILLLSISWVSTAQGQDPATEGVVRSAFPMATPTNGGAGHLGQQQLVTVQRDGRELTTVKRYAGKTDAPALTLAPLPIDIVNGDFSDGLTGWTVSESGGGASPGTVTVESEQALLMEGDSFLVTLQQTFLVPDGAELLRFELIFDPGFDQTDDFIPDAFEATLLDQDNAPVVPPWDFLATSFFNMQEDSSVNLGSATTWNGSVVEVDISGVTPGTEVTLFFDLIGADLDVDGGVRIDDAAVGCPGACTSLPPAVPNSPHDARKNRYITIDATTNEASAVAYEVTLSSMKRCSADLRRACIVDDDCPGVCDLDPDLQCASDEICGSDGPCIPTAPCVEHGDAGVVVKWIDEPFAASCVPLDDCIGQSFVHMRDDPLYRQWTESVLHITDCAIVPVGTYEIRACLPPPSEFCSNPLVVGTIEKPHLNYADCVGPVVGGAYTPPDGFTNVTDVQSYLIATQGGPTAPHTTWVDLQSGTIPVIPQQILNVGDLQTIKFGFLGQTYVETPGHENPGDCP